METNSMTLLELYNYIKRIAGKEANINTTVDDFYDLNTEDVKYSAFVIQQREHSKDTEWMNYSFYFGYVDRLTEDKSNEIEIQSTAIEILSNIINRIYKDFDISYGSVVPFTQRFTAECSGAYIAVTIPVPTNTCYEDLLKDSFNNDFTDSEYK